MSKQRLAPILAALTHTAFIVALAWTAFFLAWISLRAVDFAYPLLYQALEIEQHIARYGPENRFRRDFEHTDKEQRLVLFSEIVDAIHAGGAGLAEIRYTDSRGRAVPLLRQPEVVHLRSVARLISRLEAVSWLMLASLAGALIAMHRMQLPPPSARRVAAGSGVVVLAGGMLVFALGPEHVFNTLHTWVFPAGEQWFFYYQESLMTTLMKAPDLFGAIAALLLLAALVYGAALLAGCRFWLWPRLIRDRE